MITAHRQTGPPFEPELREGETRRRGQEHDRECRRHRDDDGIPDRARQIDVRIEDAHEVVAQMPARDGRGDEVPRDHGEDDAGHPSGPAHGTVVPVATTARRSGGASAGCLLDVRDGRSGHVLLPCMSRRAARRIFRGTATGSSPEAMRRDSQPLLVPAGLVQVQRDRFPLPRAAAEPLCVVQPWLVEDLLRTGCATVRCPMGQGLSGQRGVTPERPWRIGRGRYPRSELRFGARSRGSVPEVRP